MISPLFVADHTYGGLRLVHHWTTSVSPQASPAQVFSPAKMQGSRPHPRSQSGRLPELRSPQARRDDGLDDFEPDLRDGYREAFCYDSDEEDGSQNARPLPSQRSSVTPTQPLTQRSSDSASTVVDLSQDSDSEELPLAQPRLVRQNAEEKKQDLPAAAQVAPEDDIGAQPVQKSSNGQARKAMVRGKVTSTLLNFTLGLSHPLVSLWPTPLCTKTVTLPLTTPTLISRFASKEAQHQELTCF